MPKKNSVSARKQPTQERSKSTVEAVLTAAAQILESVGFDSATTNRIAERAGISIGSLYQYFPNKESLASALTERLVKKHATRVERKIVEMKDLPIDALLKEVISEVVTMYLGNLKMLRILAKLVPKINVIPSVIETRKKIVKIIAAELDARSKEIHCDNTELTAFIIVNAIMGVIQMTMYDEDVTYNEIQLTSGLHKMSQNYLRS